MTGRIGIIIQREFRERVCKRSFIITTLLTPLLFIGLMGGAFYIMTLQTGDTKQIEVIDRSGVVAPQLESHTALTYHPTDVPLEQLRDAGDDETYGILVIGENILADPSDVVLYTFSSSTIEVEGRITSDLRKIIEAERLKAYRIDNLQQILADVKAEVTLRSFKIGVADQGDRQSSSMLSYALSYLFGFIMYMFVLLYGVMVMQGVIEEKNSKVLEVMVSTVRPYQLMMGKILGIASVAVLQFLIWVVLIAGAGSILLHTMVPAELLSAASQSGAGELATQGLPPEAAAALANITDVGALMKMFVGFLVFFIGGYLLYAAMFAAVGSAVENVQDAQQFQTPITLPIIVGLFVMLSAMREPNGALAVWCSLIPLTSPIVMVARIPYEVPAWQMILSVVLLFLSFIAMVWVAGKIYRIGIFMHGRKPTPRELFHWIRMKE